MSNPRCTATSSQSGEPCKNPAIDGASVCRSHGGSAPQVRNRAAVRAAALQWSEGQQVDDPFTVLLRVMTVTWARANMHASRLAELVDGEDGDWDRAFTGDTIVVGENGKPVKVGEYARQLARWEHDERKLAGDLATKAAAAGVSKAYLAMLERHADAIVTVIEATLNDLGLGERIQEARGVAERHLRALPSG